MAIFGDITTIRTYIDPFTSISPCVSPYGPDKIILSESKHLAVLYDLNTCLPTKCWTFSELDSLVSPFIYDPVNEKFVAVKQLKIALFKCDDEESLEQVKLGKDVHCLVPSSCKESMVIFKNGHVQPLKAVVNGRIKVPGNRVIPDNEEIIKTTINQFTPETTWVSLLTKTQNCFSKLYMVKANFASGKGQVEAIFTVKQNYKCLTMRKDGQPIGLTENGQIHLLTAEGDELLISLKNSSVISALCLPEEDTLAVVVKEEDIYSLKIVNFKYKVITSQLTLDIVPLADFLTQSNGNIFIASCKAMLCIQYEIKPTSLASVMGKNYLPKETSSFTTTTTTTTSSSSNPLKRKAPIEENVFLDSSSDIRITCPLKENISLDELKKILPKSNELLSEKAIFSLLATILRSKCFSSQNDLCKETLNSILSRPFNHSFMVTVVKSANLNVDQFVQITDLLIDLLQIDHGYVIDWLIVILDSCLKLLLFTRNDVIKNTLKRLEEKLNSLDDSLERCQQLTTLLDDLLTCKTKLSINQMYNGVKHDKYCIEILEL